MRRSLTFPIFALAMVLALAGCKSAEERAEEHFQSAVALAAEGDYDRAIVSLRNVFQLNDLHREARRMFAEIMLNERGNSQQAYSQYLRLVEQYPDDLDARVELAQIAFVASNWEEMERHGAYAEGLNAEDPRVVSLSTARKYRAAVIAQDAPTRREIARNAVALRETQPESVVLSSIIVDDLLRSGDLRPALVEIDRMLEQDPESLLYNQQRLNVLAELGDMEAVEAHLRVMIERFPDDKTYKLTLLQFYLSRQDIDQAEAFMREMAEADPENSGKQVDLIRFLAEFRSVNAAKEEIARAVESAANPLPFLMMDATFDFAAGERETAVATLETALQNHADSDQALNAKVVLARMYLDMGNEVGARARVEEVLAEDETQPEALKMKAIWLIQSDQTDPAIAALRSALDRNPNDAQAMTLMAEAYTRSGRPQLARDYLALAVEASGNAPADTIRYARLLMADESYLPAEDLLISSLRLNSNNPDLLMVLGELYVVMEDFGRAQQVASTLRQIDTPATRNAANWIEAERINRQSGQEEAMAYLEQLASGADAGQSERIALISARMRTGDTAGALALAQEMVASDPTNENLRFMLATTYAVSGDLAEAENLYRELVKTTPARPQVWLDLSRIQQRQGNRDGAKAMIDEGLSHTPEDPTLLWAKASFLEQDGDIDGAIDIYEGLYAVNSGALAIANNLASLLSTYRDDPESLERAWAVARRFSDTEVPAVQDTYGWILHRRGNTAEALPYLESAAAGLPNDPLVNYHLAEAYLSLERNDDALKQFQRATDLAGPGDTRPQIETARQQIRTLTETGAIED